MLDFAMAQIRVLFPDIHSQAAATSQQLFCSLQSSIGIYVHTYIFKALIFSWMPVSPPISTAGEGKDVLGATSIPRLDQGPYRGSGSGPCSTGITSEQQEVSSGADAPS